MQSKLLVAVLVIGCVVGFILSSSGEGSWQKPASDAPRGGAREIDGVDSNAAAGSPSRGVAVPLRSTVMYSQRYEAEGIPSPYVLKGVVVSEEGIGCSGATVFVQATTWKQALTAETRSDGAFEVLLTEALPREVTLHSFPRAGRAGFLKTAPGTLTGFEVDVGKLISPRAALVRAIGHSGCRGGTVLLAGMQPGSNLTVKLDVSASDWTTVPVGEWRVVAVPQTFPNVLRCPWPGKYQWKVDLLDAGNSREVEIAIDGRGLSVSKVENLVRVTSAAGEVMIQDLGGRLDAAGVTVAFPRIPNQFLPNDLIWEVLGNGGWIKMVCESASTEGELSWRLRRP